MNKKLIIFLSFLFSLVILLTLTFYFFPRNNNKDKDNNNSQENEEEISMSLKDQIISLVSDTCLCLLLTFITIFCIFAIIIRNDKNTILKNFKKQLRRKN